MKQVLNEEYVRNNVKEIFVFGSNRAGRHGAGAALTAKKDYRATLGLGSGLQLDGGYSYAIPTKSENLNTLNISTISLYVDQFTRYVDELTEQDAYVKFMITRVGCGLAGRTDEEMCPLFLNLYVNHLCYFDEAWKPMMPKDSQFWGTFK